MAKVKKSGQRVWVWLGSQLPKATLLIQRLPQQPIPPEEWRPRGHKMFRTAGLEGLESRFSEYISTLVLGVSILLFLSFYLVWDVFS